MISLTPIASVVGGRREPIDDGWGEEQACLQLVDGMPDGLLRGLEEFGHLEVIFVFHLVDPSSEFAATRRPRGRADLPEIGALAQRHSNRIGRLGLSRCAILEVSDRSVLVEGLDAIDGTPILDIKPWFDAFGPRGPRREPSWVAEIAKGYFRSTDREGPHPQQSSEGS